jgi:hypothetical protein
MANFQFALRASSAAVMVIRTSWWQATQTMRHQDNGARRKTLRRACHL